jgi:hypothetical protein
MWGVSTELMCDQHLLGEHNEMHMLVGSIRKHPHGEAIARGHAEKGQINTALIQERHDDLAGEMEQRGMSHDSPMDYDDDLDVGVVDAERDPMFGATNLKDELADRCIDCRKRILAASEQP